MHIKLSTDLQESHESFACKRREAHPTTDIHEKSQCHTQEALARVQAAEAALDALMEGQLNEDMNVDEAPITRGKRAKQQGVQEGEPLSFSAVDLNQPESVIRSQFPQFPVCVHAAC